MRAWSTRSIPPASPPSPAGGYPLVLLALVSVVMAGLASWSRLFGGNTSPLTWWLARASGVTLYLLLWATTMLGFALTTKLLEKRVNRATVFSLHGYLTMLSYAFLALHVLSLAADRFSAFSLADLLIPFHSPTREPWTGFGVVAAYLLVGIAASFSTRKLTGYRFWRLTHWLTFPLYALALAHGIGGGTDGTVRPFLMMYLGTAGLVAVALLYRIKLGRRLSYQTPLVASPSSERPASPARAAEAPIAPAWSPSVRNAAAVAGAVDGSAESASISWPRSDSTSTSKVAGTSRTRKPIAWP